MRLNHLQNSLPYLVSLRNMLNPSCQTWFIYRLLFWLVQKYTRTSIYKFPRFLGCAWSPLSTELKSRVICAVFFFYPSSIIKMKINCSQSQGNFSQKKQSQHRRCIKCALFIRGRDKERLHSASSECCISCLQQLCWKVKYYSILCSALHAKYFSSQMTLVCALCTMAPRSR